MTICPRCGFIGGRHTCIAERKAAADEHAASTGGRWTAERVRGELHRGESAHG